VLLVHGWNGRGTQLGAFVAPLVARGFQPVALDAPGHGASSGNGASLFHFADAIDSALDAVRPLFGPARGVIAHSLGGAATTFAMHRRLGEPTTRTERALEPNRLPAERFVFVAPPIDVREWVGAFTHALGAGPRLEEALRRRIEERFGVPLASLYGPTLARDIEAPMLLVHDEEDRDVPVARGRLLASSWSGAEQLITRGLGHTRILKEPAVIERVVDFVTR
jgi:pimeloyl-ACP methyl ester carboxylesterase